MSTQSSTSMTFDKRYYMQSMRQFLDWYNNTLLLQLCIPLYMPYNMIDYYNINVTDMNFLHDATKVILSLPCTTVKSAITVTPQKQTNLYLSVYISLRGEDLALQSTHSLKCVAKLLNAKGKDCGMGGFVVASSI